MGCVSFASCLSFFFFFCCLVVCCCDAFENPPCVGTHARPRLDELAVLVSAVVSNLLQLFLWLLLLLLLLRFFPFTAALNLLSFISTDPELRGEPPATGNRASARPAFIFRPHTSCRLTAGHPSPWIHCPILSHLLRLVVCYLVNAFAYSITPLTRYMGTTLPVHLTLASYSPTYLS